MGKVKHALFDSTGKKIVVGTEENVVAVLHAGSGKSTQFHKKTIHQSAHLTLCLCLWEFR